MANRIAESEKLARIKIEDRMGGWRLDSGQRDRITARLNSFKNVPYDLYVNPAEFNFLETIDGILQSAGWTRKKPSGLISIAEKAAVTVVTGITISISENKTGIIGPLIESAASALASALRSEGIEVKAERSTIVDPSANPSAVHVVVGRRP